MITIQEIVYKKALDKMLKERDISLPRLSEELGYKQGYLYSLFYQGDGNKITAARIPRPIVFAMAQALHCDVEDLLMEPQESEKELAEKIHDLAAVDAEVIVSAINAAANMLHNDLRALLAEWKPKQPKEPKYAIKEREQP